MSKQIVVDGLNIEVVQTITGITLTNARQVERTEDGMEFGVQVTLMSGDAPLGNRKVRQAIQATTSLTWVELNAGAQASLAKDFDDLTVIEAQNVQGQVLATKMIGAINSVDAGISIADVSALVVTIVTALA
jgi:hypothetical protein